MFGNAVCKKEYLAGYTGHVPLKNDQFGQSQGAINRILLANSRNPSRLRDQQTESPHERSFYGVSHSPSREEEELQKGNRSKRAKGWIGGQTINVLPQHIPGFVPSVVAENIYSHTYAKSTSKAILKEYDRGISPIERFNTTSNITHSPDIFRTFKSSQKTKDQKDYNKYYKKEMIYFEDRSASIPVDTLPPVGYTGFQSLYKQALELTPIKTKSNTNLNRFVNRKRNLDIRTNKDWGTLTTGFQQALLKNPKSVSVLIQRAKTNENIKLSIAGYTGHRKGYHAQNYYGKSYRDCTLQSKLYEQLARK